MDSDGNMVPSPRRSTCSSRPRGGARHRHHHGRRHGRLRAEARIGQFHPAGKRMLSSMSPTLVLDPQAPFMALGSPGATASSRRWPGHLERDRSRHADPAAIRRAPLPGRTGNLSMEGRYSINATTASSSSDTRSRCPRLRRRLGGVHAVLFDHAAGILHGGADPRRDGSRRVLTPPYLRYNDRSKASAARPCGGWIQRERTVKTHLAIAAAAVLAAPDTPGLRPGPQAPSPRSRPSSRPSARAPTSRW